MLRHLNTFAKAFGGRKKGMRSAVSVYAKIIERKKKQYCGDSYTFANQADVEAKTRVKILP